MNSMMPTDGESPVRWRVSAIARLVAVFAYSIPLIGGALSSLLLMRAMQAMRAAETAGISAVMAAVKEAEAPITISLYLAVVLGLVVIIVLMVRAFAETKTASPPIWFFLLCALFCLVPAALFWRAEWLIFEVLSPGSSLSSSGISAVGAEIATLLMISIVLAPVVLFVFVVLFAMPLKSGSKTRWASVAGASAIEVLLIAVAVAIPLLISGPQRKKESAALPENVKSAEADHGIQKHTSAIVILTNDSKIFLSKEGEIGQKTEVAVTTDQLPENLKRLMEGKSPDRRIVYLKADANAAYEKVFGIFEILRRIDVERAGLVVYAAIDPKDPYDLYPKRFEVKVPAAASGSEAPPRPNPSMLVAYLSSDGKIKLNRDEMGMISDPKELSNTLRTVFTKRENSGILREGTNEVEKTVFLKVEGACKYGDMIRLVDAVRLAGGEPIGILFEEPVIPTPDKDALR